MLHRAALLRHPSPHAQVFIARDTEQRPEAFQRAVPLQHRAPRLHRPRLLQALAARLLPLAHRLRDGQVELAVRREGVQPRCSPQVRECHGGLHARLLLEDRLEFLPEELVQFEALKGRIPEEDLRGLIVDGLLCGGVVRGGARLAVRHSQELPVLNGKRDNIRRAHRRQRLQQRHIPTRHRIHIHRPNPRRRGVPTLGIRHGEEPFGPLEGEVRQSRRGAGWDGGGVHEAQPERARPVLEGADPVVPPPEERGRDPDVVPVPAVGHCEVRDVGRERGGGGGLEELDGGRVGAGGGGEGQEVVWEELLRGGIPAVQLYAEECGGADGREVLVPVADSEVVVH
mmetsp:Transcript_21823/g.51831  ORF Transcript_21823/g.51831 Transcript_21823/m.51831 type:complete len:342 (+) Transcript_21823:2306-3331(+)